MDKILSELSSSLKQILKVKILTYLIHEATDTEEWFCGRDVCLILGCIDALTKKVKKAYKCSLKSLADTPESGLSPELNNENKAVYISDPPGDLNLGCVSWCKVADCIVLPNLLEK